MPSSNNRTLREECTVLATELVETLVAKVDETLQDIATNTKKLAEQVIMLCLL